MNIYNIIARPLAFIGKSLFKIKVTRIDNIPNDTGVILAPNHKSNWDPIIILSALKHKKLSAVCKKELVLNGFIANLFEKLDIIPINRNSPEISSVKKIIRLLKNNSSMIIFPEGTRVKGTELGEAKKGVALFAIKSNVPIVPISIKTTYKIFSKVEVVIGEPIYISKNEAKDNIDKYIDEITIKVMDSIKRNLQ